MHPNPIFRQITNAENLAFVRDRSFGILSMNADPVPLLAHIPFVLSPDGSFLDFHLVRSNPIARAIGSGAEAVLAVSGPDGYISPDWYGIPDQVPTWNYIAVHLRGHLELRDQDDLHSHLVELSAQFEARLEPKPPWLIDKVSDEALKKLMRMIVPCRMKLSQVDGTWKLGQNKTEAARISAADEIAKTEIGQELAALSAAMRTPQQS
ncbi:MAG: FMN-binding negative transcriptional regulator [Marinosulfonomonas sp.]